MNFIDTDRPIKSRKHAAFRDPAFILPVITACIDNGCVAGRRLMKAGVRVSLERQLVTVLIEHVVLVACAGRDARNENLPDAVRGMQAHDMAATIPIIEITDDTDA